MNADLRNSLSHVYIWQQILSPHMRALAEGLRDVGVHVTFVYCKEYDANRKALGWTQPDIPGIEVVFDNTEAGLRAIAQSAPDDSIHLCEGVRANYLIGKAQRVLRQSGVRQFACMETVQDSGLNGLLRKALYHALFVFRRRHLTGVLAIGATMPDWLARRGVPEGRIFPFTYFLPARHPAPNAERESSRFRILYVGQLINRKRVDLLLEATTQLSGEVELQIIGSGPEQASLRRHSKSMLANVNVSFLGARDISEMAVLMSSADCLVLPSDFDGWGAVVSEALMVGTPAICSDACGSAEAVRASGVGGVFRRGDATDLACLLTEVQKHAPLTERDRARLADWGRSFSGDVGARYLLDIVAHLDGRAMRPTPPWRVSMPDMGP